MELIDDERFLRVAGAVSPIGNGRYGVDLSKFYTVMGYPNGGYLQCVMASAALAGAVADGSAHLHVTGLTTNYISAPEVGPAELVVDVRRVGKGVSFVHVALEQGGVVTTESIATLGTLKADSPVRYVDAVAPTLAPREECRASTGSADEVSIAHIVELRLDPSCAGWTQGILHDRAETKGWLRLNDGDATWDAWNLLFASDAMPPATFPIGSSGWVPTLQLSSYVRRIPEGEWLKARQWCQIVADNLVDERCELFDERDQLVAVSSQLAMVRFPTRADE
jgi:acyl-CoA thioesterase